MVLLPALKPACSSATIFSACGFNLQNDLQHDFDWMADEADRSVVLALLQVAFLEPFSHLSNLGADCHESSDYCFFTCVDLFCWDVGNSS